MNASVPFLQSAYGCPAIRSARDVEYDVLSQITRSLILAPKTCEGSETILAVSRNSELWTVLVGALLDPSNLLDAQLKSGLVKLAQFSLRHGQKVLSGRGRTDILIEINISIMKGLRGGGCEE